MDQSNTPSQNQNIQPQQTQQGQSTSPEQNAAHRDQQQGVQQQQDREEVGPQLTTLILGFHGGQLFPVTLLPREFLPLIFGIQPQGQQQESRSRTMEQENEDEVDLTYLRVWYEMLTNKIQFKEKREQQKIDNNEAVIELISYDIHLNKIPLIFARETTLEGLDKRKIQNMPCIIYNPDKGPKFYGEDAKCGICLTEYDSGDHVKILLCLHKFHQQCVDNWLLAHPTCPLCKWNLNKTTFHHTYHEVTIN